MWVEVVDNDNPILAAAATLSAVNNDGCVSAAEVANILQKTAGEIVPSWMS